MDAIEEAESEDAGEQDTLIRISLCGGAFKERQPTTWVQMAEIFDEFAVSFEMLEEMPYHIMQNESLIVQIEHKFYDWKSGGPLLMAYLVFKKPLPAEAVGPSQNQIYLEPATDF